MAIKRKSPLHLNRLFCGFVLRTSGGDSGTRTHDLCVANASLYQLSYIPINCIIKFIIKRLVCKAICRFF